MPGLVSHNLLSYKEKVVPGIGLEPIRYFYRGILNPLRLPFRHPGREINGVILGRRFCTSTVADTIESSTMVGKAITLSHFGAQLPERLIARRSTSARFFMLLHWSAGDCSTTPLQLKTTLKPDLLVLNDTRVVKARLHAVKILVAPLRSCSRRFW